MFYWKIDRDVGRLDRWKCIRHIIATPRPVLIPRGVAHFFWIERRNIMKRSGLGVFPSERGSLRVKSSRKVMNGRRLKMSLRHVVSARPEKLDRSFGGTRNVRGFNCIIDSEASAKSTTNQRDVHIHIGRRDPEQLSNLLLQSFGRLCGRPDRAAILSNVRQAVHGF